MKFTSRIAALVASMFVTLTAMGGHGSGGGVFGRTSLMLQSQGLSQAVLLFEGSSTNIPESDTTPRLMIPQEEYNEFLKEVEKEVSTGSAPYVLDVEMANGTIRYYELKHVGDPSKEPVVMYLVEKTSCKDSE